MYKSIVIGSVLAVTSIAAFANSCSAQYYVGKSPQILNSAMLKNTAEVCYTGFATMHSGISKTPLWSAEHLTAERLSSSIKRKDSFHPESSLSRGTRAELSDYERSGYDRGHMAPSADMPDTLSQHESFSLANMIPQNANNNRGLWAGVEAAVRNEVSIRGELYVITGPMFIGQVKAIGANKVLVPTHIFKLVYAPLTNEAGAYVVENKEASDWKVISVAQLEQMSKLNLLPTVSAKVKATAMNLPGPVKINFSNSKGNTTERGLIKALKKFEKTL